MYDAGHVHDYASTWPICNGDICKDSSGKAIKSYENPKGTVHITEGNGGVPSVAGSNSLRVYVERCRMVSSPWNWGAYGRIMVYNNTHLQYSHVENPTSKISDSFVIKQMKHGPFAE